jgi:hypothetical protein
MGILRQVERGYWNQRNWVWDALNYYTPFLAGLHRQHQPRASLTASGPSEDDAHPSPRQWQKGGRPYPAVTRGSTGSGTEGRATGDAPHQRPGPYSLSHPWNPFEQGTPEGEEAYERLRSGPKAPFPPYNNAFELLRRTVQQITGTTQEEHDIEYGVRLTPNGYVGQAKLKGLGDIAFQSRPRYFKQDAILLAAMTANRTLADGYLPEQEEQTGQPCGNAFALAAEGYPAQDTYGHRTLEAVGMASTRGAASAGSHCPIPLKGNPPQGSRPGKTGSLDQVPNDYPPYSASTEEDIIEIDEGYELVKIDEVD